MPVAAGKDLLIGSLRHQLSRVSPLAPHLYREYADIVYGIGKELSQAEFQGDSTGIWATAYTLVTFPLTNVEQIYTKAK
jgi:hypothetical protein